MTDPSKLHQQQRKHQSPDKLDARILAAAKEQAAANAENNKATLWNWMPPVATAAVLVIGFTFIFNTNIFLTSSSESDLVSESASIDFDLENEVSSVDQRALDGFTEDEAFPIAALEQLQETSLAARIAEESEKEAPFSISGARQAENSSLLVEYEVAEPAPELAQIVSEPDTTNTAPMASAASGGDAPAEPESIAGTPISFEPAAEEAGSLALSPTGADFDIAAIPESSTEEADAFAAISGLSGNADPEQQQEAVSLEELAALVRQGALSDTSDSERIALFEKRRMSEVEIIRSMLLDVSSLAPDIIFDLRYTESNNFVGEPIDGYESPKALLSKPAIEALAAVQNELTGDGLGLKIFDAYRPQRAVDHFIRWSQNSDESTKTTYYPNIEKDALFDAGYLAERSSHSRGSTVDLTIIKMNPDGSFEELDMGTIFDFFDPSSWPDSTEVSEAAQKNRRFLRDLMTKHGFEPFETEWWHFTLENEPYPNQYFDLPIE